MCARQGAFTWRCKSSTDPTGGTVSRTARVSIARWNLKEAAGKALARRTEIAYEASMWDEEANVSKVRYLYGRHGRKCGGHKREGGCALPGEVCRSCPVLLPPKGGGMSRQKSAEGILRSIDRTEGPNLKYVTGALNFDEQWRRRKSG